MTQQQAFQDETGITVVKFDVCSFEACNAAVEQLAAELGPDAILVNNAGITRDGTLAHVNRDMWDAVIDTNLGSCYDIYGKAQWCMHGRQYGRIINVGHVEATSTSPIPRMREAIRSGWNSSSTSDFSPVPTNKMGFPVTWRTDSAAPPRASPSALVRITPVRTRV